MEAIQTADALLDDVGNDGKKKKKKKDGTGKSKKEKGADGADGKKKKKKAQKPTAADDVPAKADDGAEEDGGNTAKAEGEEVSEAVQETAELAVEKPLKLKGSIGEGSNHSNFSHQSSVKILGIQRKPRKATSSK